MVEELTAKVLKVKRTGEIPVYMNVEESVIFFQVDLGNVSKIAGDDLYFRLLDLNTEILPVSIGISTTNTSDPRLVLIESREISNLDDNEILSVFAALELAVDKVEEMLSEYLK